MAARPPRRCAHSDDEEGRRGPNDQLSEVESRGAGWCQLLADQIEALSDLAARFASLLEAAATRGDAERRLRVAQREREIAAIARRNAARLREPGGHGATLDPYPSLFSD